MINKNNIRILIVRLSAIGDVIHSMPILHSLKRKFPDSQIGWVVEDRAADLIIDNPLIDRVYVMPKQRWKKRGFSINNIKEFISVINSIKSEQYDIAIDLQELFKSAFITYLSGAKRKIAHSKTREFAHIFANEKLKAHNTFDPNKMIIERYLEPAEYLGAPIDEVKFSLPPVTQPTINKVDKLFKDIDKNKPVIAFIPGTIWKTKHWIEEYWNVTLKQLCDENNIIFIGANTDLGLISRITADVPAGKYISLAGKTNLLELIEVFNRCNIVIATDTGPAHIANATDKPVIITIFGPTSYKRSCPYGDKHYALSTELDCQPCFERKCTRKNIHMECMKIIDPNMVIKKVKEKLTFSM